MKILDVFFRADPGVFVIRFDSRGTLYECAHEPMEAAKLIELLGAEFHSQGFVVSAGMPIMVKFNRGSSPTCTCTTQTLMAKGCQCGGV